jgi:circadian clock protein KaiB
VGEQKEIRDSAQEFERSLRNGLLYDLHLYVAGTSSYSLRAVEAMNRICMGTLKNRCQLHIIDIYESPELAREAQILAVPTLVRLAPPPARRLVGDFSDSSRVLQFLGLPSPAGEGGV